LTCSYPENTPYAICRCSNVAANYLWQCAEARFDAGVDGTAADATQP
jgi:hypothetical protein